jgi:hypothetical protein
MSENTERIVITKPATIQEVTAPREGKHHASVTILLDDKEGLPAGYGKTPKLLVDTRIWSMELLQADMNHETKADLTFEVSDGQNGKTNWLTKWNGIEKPAYEGNKGGGRKGGGGNWQPKSPTEVHAPSIGGIVKSGLEAGIAAGIMDKDKLEAIIKTGINAYVFGIETVEAKFKSAPKTEATTEAA